MWTSSYGRWLLNSAAHGWTSDTLAPLTANPVGWFIQPLTEITMSEPTIPASAIGTPIARCTRGPTRSQLYTYIAMKIASVKNAKPSIPNASPNTDPNVAMKFGQSSPSSNDRIVPVTTPTANRTTSAFDQRRGGGRAGAGP